MIELAWRQGLLLECPIPPPRAQPAPTAAASETARFQLLSQLTQGKTGQLEFFRPPDVACADDQLDEVQRDAVRKALGTPDICLIQGEAGTGKSRVAAEVVVQAVARGQRVLLLAPGSAAVDRVLEMVSGRGAVFALRCLGRNEALERLPPAAQAQTFAERSRILRQRTLESARRTQRETEQRLARHPAERSLWPRLLELSEGQARTREEVARLGQLGEQLAADVKHHVQQVLSGCSPDTRTISTLPGAEPNHHFFSNLSERHQDYQRRQAEFEAARQRIADERDSAAERLDALTARSERLRPLALAKRGRRWWSVAWWRATFGGDVAGQCAESEAEQQATRGELAKLDRDLASLAAEAAAARRQFTEEVEALAQRHIAEQHEAAAAQLRSARAKEDELSRDWNALVVQLPQELRPVAPAAAAVRGAHQRWEQNCAQDEEKARFLQHWLEYVEEFSSTLADRLPRLANVVAATIAALQDDEHFGDGRGDQHFDLLVLEDAHSVSEMELFKVTRRAKRWVLIGELAWEPAERDAAQNRPSSPRGSHTARHTPTRPARLAQPACFRKLWSHLHCDPSVSPYDWFLAGDRLCCRLRPVPQQWSSYAETEPVADRPDVELRIVSPPRGEPFLAEVLFPAQTPLHEAKQYIYQELQEVAVRTRCRRLLWREAEDKVTLPLADTRAPATDDVQLTDGVTERLATPPARADRPHVPLARTVALEFAADKDWTLERAREWVYLHLGWRDLGRTALLERAHRMSEPLAAVLHKLLHEPGRQAYENGHAAGAAEKQADEAVPTAPVEFVAVPPVPDRHGRRRRDEEHGGHRPVVPAALPVGGAGLEVELVPGRAPAQLPDDLRGLPPQGVANLPEAQAVIRKLEEVAREPALRQAAAGAACPAIGVIALHTAQAELIRRLIRKSPRLAQCGLTIEVGLPAAFRHRECLVCAVSLTRSQGSRAVAYGDTSEDLPLALTRARQRLILFGDAGQLARRGQWRGALDHLDEAAAAAEKHWVDQLVKYVQHLLHHS